MASCDYHRNGGYRGCRSIKMGDPPLKIGRLPLLPSLAGVIRRPVAQCFVSDSFELLRHKETDKRADSSGTCCLTLKLQITHAPTDIPRLNVPCIVDQPLFACTHQSSLTRQFVKRERSTISAYASSYTMNARLFKVGHHHYHRYSLSARLHIIQ